MHHRGRHEPPLASNRRMALAAGAGVLLVVVVGFFALQRLQILNDGTDFAAGTQRGRYELARTLQLLIDMGSGVRRYEATLDLDSFKEAQAAAVELPAAFEEVRRYVSDDPEQRAALGLLSDLADRRRAQMRQVIDAAHAGDLGAVRGLIASGEGPRLVDACRALIARMQQRQSERLEQRVALQSSARVLVASAIVATAALAAVLILTVAALSLWHARRLARTQDELHTTLSSIGDAVISTDGAGAVRFMNSVAEQLTGWTTSAARGLALNRVFHIVNETSRAVVDSPVDRVLREGRVIGLANHTILIDRNGAERPIEDSAAPIRGVDGSLQGVVLVFRDATSERAAQRALRESEAALREANVTLENRIAERTAQLLARETYIKTFFEHSSEYHALLIEMPGGRFRYEEVNPATLRFYDKPRTAVIGKTLEEVFDPPTAGSLTEHLARCLELDAPYRFERAQGEGFIEAIATPVPAAAGVGRAVLVSARDVTERVRWERQSSQSQKMEAIAQLTGGVAHDFNNLLMVITGGLGLIERTAEATRRQRIMDGMRQAAERGAALSRQLLAFSRRQPLKAEPVDLVRQIEGMRELLDRTLRGDVHVTTELAADLWPVKVDPAELELVLLNLCVNARDAMPDGGVITLRAENSRATRQGSAGDVVRLTVTDPGTGMPPQVLNRAFEPFFTTKDLGRGSGLGLPQVYGFAQQSGGSVRIDSTVGRGTTVELLLPRSETAPVLPAPRVESDATARLRTFGRSILLVEDDDEVAELVAEMLRDMGHRVTRAASAQAALGALEDDDGVDLVFSDIMMPGAMDGVDLAHEIKRRHARIPVLLTSGYAGATLDKAESAHVSVLRKPYDFEALERALMTALV